MKRVPMHGFKRGWLAKLVLVSTLFCVSMDAVIDALEIWYGKDIAISYEIPVIRSFPARANVRVHEGLYTGSYFEAQKEPGNEYKTLPGPAYNLILSSTSVPIFESGADCKTFTLLLHSLISLPPPQISLS